MKIPKKILIGGHEVDVDIQRGDHYFPHGGDYCGWTQTIRLNVADNISESNMSETLLHEIIEAINHANELKLRHGQISCLSEQLFSVIRNNKLDFSRK